MLADPAFERLLQVLHDSLARNGEPKGRVELRTYDEAEALGGLIRKRLKPGRTIGVAEIDRRLREETRFHCSLADAVELHRGAPIVRPKAVRARFEAERERALKRCYELLPGLKLSTRAQARMVSWMHYAETDLRAGFRRWGEAKLVAAVRAVALAFERMPETGGVPTIFLAELAAEVAGGSHGLDVGQPAGTLLFRALEYHHPETARREPRGSAAWKAALLAEAGIARDSISVRVDTFGLWGDTPYLRELRKAAVDRPFTLNTLSQLGEHVRAWREVAFVVENPTVFAALIQHVRLFAPENHPTLVCTNGNLNLADKALLDALVSSGAHLFYSGDFDSAGLEIAATILARYPGNASPWRMDAGDYVAAIRADGNALDPRSLQRVRREFPGLVAEMMERRCVAFQEPLITLLSDDINRFITRRETPPRRGTPPDAGATAASVR